MAALIDLAVPGLGSGFDLIVKGLKKLYSKYSQLKEGKELCLNLHGRLQTFIHELSKIEIQTVQKEELLSRLKNLVKDYYNTVVEYANETNYIKRAVRVSKFIEAIKQYNERLDFLLKVIVVKHTADFVEWRVQYEQDTGAMMAQLTDINESQKVILRAIEHLPDDMILLLKRELKQTPDGKSHPLDGTLRKIINVTEQVSNKTYQTPPNWYISINECQLYKPAIDIKGQSEIFTGKWQGVQVAIKKFRLVGENPVFDKHYEIWRSLLHPHVAQLYGVGSDEDAPFMVYEFASKKSLDRHWDYLSQQKDIWQLLYQASLGLSYLHARNVVHGNLSSSKLLVTSQNQVKLFGFGASYVRQDNK
ncbi:Serine/threonine protein kinase, partial [Phytophthora megakarya]